MVTGYLNPALKMVRQLSLVAYKDISQDGTKQSQTEKILQFIRQNAQGYTRNEISRLLNIIIFELN